MMEDDMDADGILDTSALSEEEEKAEYYNQSSRWII